MPLQVEGNNAVWHCGIAYKLQAAFQSNVSCVMSVCNVAIAQEIEQVTY